MNNKTFPIRYFFSIQVPVGFSQIAFPIRHQQVGWHSNFAQEEPLGLRCLTNILATCVVENVSTYLDILALDFWVTFGASSIFLGCQLILRRRLVLYNQVVSEWRPLLLLLSFARLTDPCSKSSFTIPRSTTRPLYFWSFGSNSFLRWQMSTNVAKWTFFLPLFVLQE